jgi:hypothetical protein
MIALLLPAMWMASAVPAFAQGTKLWTQSRFEEFEKGTPEGVQITSDGKLRSGPMATEMLTTASTFVWAVTTDKAGTIYLATGSPATVQRVKTDGNGKTTSEAIFTTKALAVQALAAGPDGNLYAATLPDGKIYRLKPGASAVDEASAEVVFDLATAAKADSAKKQESKSHYIWNLRFDATGHLYIATGGPGVIYRIDASQPHPASEVFFKSDEQHIRALAWDKAGNLIAGSDGSGLVYRIDPKGKGYVLFSAPRREVTALAIGADGTIYAADVGDKSRNPLPQLPLQAGMNSITISFVQPASVQAANASTAVPEGSEIYALKPNEAPRKIWSGKDEVVYQLVAAHDGIRALTGNRGRILTIHPDGSFSDIAHLEAQQAVAWAATPSGWLVATANTGKLFRLDQRDDRHEDHAYASDVLDTGATSRWGHVETDPGSRDFQIWTRSGNVEQPVRSARDWGWSDWQPVADGKIASPAGRYLQWKAVLAEGGEVAGVGVNYLPVNAAPEVDDVLVAPGAKYVPQQPLSGQAPTVTLAFPNGGQNGGTTFDANAASLTSPIQAQKDRTFVTVRWTAHDDNGDELTYDLYLRGDGEQVWRPLKTGLTDKVYSFDAASLPDGGYKIRVVASDAPSHTPGEVLKGELVSERFELDTTAPAISALKAGPIGPVVPSDCKQAPCEQRWRISVSFEARDATSPISKAEYSIDAGPWQYIEPVGELSDSKEEHYSFAAPLPVRRASEEPESAEDKDADARQAEHLVSVRAYDRHENMATAKVVVPAAVKTAPKEK